MSELTNVEGSLAGSEASAKRAVISARGLAQLAAWVALGLVVGAGILLAGHLRGGKVSPALAKPSAFSATNIPAVGGIDPITGRHVSLAQFAGRPVLVNVWASWCPGCNQEARALARFAAAHPGVQVLGVDIEDTTGGARAFYRKWHVPYPSMADPGGTLSAQLAVTGVPTTLFLDAHHHLVDRLLGAGTLADFDGGLQAIDHGVKR